MTIRNTQPTMRAVYYISARRDRRHNTTDKRKLHFEMINSTTVASNVLSLQCTYS